MSGLTAQGEKKFPHARAAAVWLARFGLGGGPLAQYDSFDQVKLNALPFISGKNSMQFYLK